MKHILPLAALLVLFAACGDDSDDGGLDSHTCCINGEYYDCVDSDLSCFESGHTCERDPSKDASECSN